MSWKRGCHHQPTERAAGLVLRQTRPLRDRRQQHEGVDAAGVSCRELDGARAASRDADDRDPLDAQPIEQCRREVGLLLG
jgi:hypothetical protein